MMYMPGPDNLVVAVRDVSFCHPVPIYLSRAFRVFVRFEKELVQKSSNYCTIFVLVVVGIVLQSVIPIQKKKTMKRNKTLVILNSTTFRE